MARIIGIDFDNTLVSYDELMYRLAMEGCLIGSGVERSKRAVREAIRQSPAGDDAWQRVQAIAYGERMEEARLNDGVRSFFEQCRRHGDTVYIVSHKTAFASVDDARTNLREAALAWMAARGFFSTEGLGLSRETVWFEATRQEKVNRINRLRCTHFIDDLEETFLEPSFPAAVEKILYVPQIPRPSLDGVRIVASWKELTDYLFGASD